MPLTPIEIKNKTFSVAFKGYNKNQVKAFLITLSKEYEDMRNERVALAHKVDELSIRLAAFEKTEGLLKDTLVTAQKATTDIKDTARKEADLIVGKAKMEAENVKKEAQEQMRKINERINELESHKMNLIGQIKALVTNITMLIDRELQQKKTSNNG